MSGTVVVGAGLAGLRVAQALRLNGYPDQLVIVGDEAEGPYSRPPLSKEILGEDATLDSCRFNVADTQAEWILGHAATALDTEHCTIELDDGRLLPYQNLVVATGCRPRLWPGPAPRRGVHVLRTLADAQAMSSAARRARRVVIVGGGFIGCEIAATWRHRGLDVVLIDATGQLMMPLGPEIGQRARSWHEAAGVEVILGAQVERILGGDEVTGLRLTDGRVLDADLVVIGIGAVPNTEWLADSSLELIDGGILCDANCMAVGASNIAAVGDVASLPDPWTGLPRRVEHWSNAVETAFVAAASLLSKTALAEPTSPLVPSFWSDQYGHKIKAIGWLGAADESLVTVDEPRSQALTVEFRRAGQAVGAVTVNSQREHLRYRRLLTEYSFDNQWALRS